MAWNQQIPSRRLLVVMPSPLGDTVMATPTLRALRQLYTQTHITALVMGSVRPAIDGCPWVDRFVTVRPRCKGPAGRRSGSNRRGGPVVLARRLAAARFDTAVLLPNSFRAALLARMAGIARRVGYDRDGRGFLLTDRLLPRRDRGRFVPVPTRDYYLGITRYLGAVDPDPTLQLFTRPEHDAQADRILLNEGVGPNDPRPLVLISPGASYGDAKVWYPERFAAVADRCVRELGAVVAVTGAPGERAILDRVLASAGVSILDLPTLGVDLAILKSVVRRSSLVITNDTGPRHMAAAFDVPVITIFGPTDPAWTRIDFDDERQVSVDVFCRPCQKKRCPLDHRCMTQIHAGMVFEKAADLLMSTRSREADTAVPDHVQ